MATLMIATKIQYPVCSTPIGTAEWAQSEGGNDAA
jgi:hypothetical protein